MPDRYVIHVVLEDSFSIESEYPLDSMTMEELRAFVPSLLAPDEAEVVSVTAKREEL